MARSQGRAVDHGLVRSQGRAVDHSLVRSQGRAVDHSLVRSQGRAVDHSLVRSQGRAVDHSLVRSRPQPGQQTRSRPQPGQHESHLGSLHMPKALSIPVFHMSIWVRFRICTGKPSHASYFLGQGQESGTRISRARRAHLQMPVCKERT
jgi:hypothetical protein